MKAKLPNQNTLKYSIRYNFQLMMQRIFYMSDSNSLSFVVQKVSVFGFWFLNSLFNSNSTKTNNG